ncbi:MAG TPA: hypothetical protein VFK54_01555 [Candidatus Limnocylindrales bacterium]|nr:hypothetical protein [Candidatus Limnocylindrales bacterium]
MVTVGELIERAVAAHARLGLVAEEVEDEATYLADLQAAWAARLRAVAAARGGEPADPAVVAALDAAEAQVDRIADPHRAFDWLSTLPQVVLLSLGEAP